MPRFLLLALAGTCVYADSIAIEITPARRALVQEHYSVAGPAEFTFLAGSCARIEAIQSGGRTLEPSGSGPWMTVQIPAASHVDLSYQVTPYYGDPRNCDVPILMPKHPIESVSITVRDLGSNLAGIAVPHFIEDSELGTWTAKFAAVPSHINLEWETGSDEPAPPAGPSGLFAWNFWGLVGILVTWTVAYLLWARRQAS